jgi:hypothetical protein
MNGVGKLNGTKPSLRRVLQEDYGGRAQKGWKFTLNKYGIPG